MAGTPILFFATSSSPSTQFNVGGAGVTITSSGQQIIRYVPQRTYADVVSTNGSPSYAPSTMYPYVVGFIAANDPSKRAWHDQLAGSIVVQRL